MRGIGGRRPERFLMCRPIPVFIVLWPPSYGQCGLYLVGSTAQHMCAVRAYKATDLEDLRNGKNSSYAESFNAVGRRLEAMSFNMSLPHYIFMLQVTANTFANIQNICNHLTNCRRSSTIGISKGQSNRNKWAQS